MNTTNPTPENVSPHRPRYIFLGTDTTGGTHLYRTVDETIYAFTSEGRIEHRFDIEDHRTVDDYIAHVTATRDWYNKTYGRDAFLDRLAEAV